MSTRLKVDPRSAVPLWRQIEEGLRGLVAAGLLRPGGGVPSVRELARELRVNPATVVKACQRLVEAGLFEVRRGEGTFVAAKLPQPGRAERRRGLEEGARRYAAQALSVGAELEEASSALEVQWGRLAGKGEER
ncbi:MAG: GntR family transcriptional regulator [Acidobacteriota bacterium]